MKNITDEIIKKTPNEKYTAVEVILPGVVEPSGLLIQEKEIDSPKPGQVILKMQATGISFAEQSMRRDRYPGQPKFPFVPGYDIVGGVVAIGEGVDPAKIGKRYAVLTNQADGQRWPLSMPMTCCPFLMKLVR